MDTDNVRLLDRLSDLNTRVTVLEGWRVSLKNDLDGVAKHSIEVDEKCRKIQEYLDERKAQRQRNLTLLHDLKKWLLVLVAGWLLMTFLDGARVGVIEWLKRPISGQQGQ